MEVALGVAAEHALGTVSRLAKVHALVAVIVVALAVVV